NRIPDKMWKELTLASLSSKLRAIIQDTENLREIHFNSHDEIIKYLVTKTECEELKAKFDKSFREKTESPSQYLMRLTHMLQYVLTNDVESQMKTNSFTVSTTNNLLKYY
ncbi:hypothetical protein SNEBB_003470, partial [Seison nebaliae]